MNITLTRTQHIGRHLRLQHITAVCGLGIALGAAFTTGGWHAESIPARATHYPYAATFVATNATPPFVFYIVGSREEKTLIESFISAESMEKVDLADVFHDVALVTTPDEEATIRRSIGVVQELDLPLQVADLRQR
jgi:hypothetical protein